VPKSLALNDLAGGMTADPRYLPGNWVSCYLRLLLLHTMI